LPDTGTLIEGKYKIVSKLREGGMGAIYKVRHRLLDELRVIKVMRREFTDNEDLQHRFTLEARTATRLRHPNLVEVQDFALDPDGTAYIVMEFIEGVTLADVLKSEGPPELPLTLEIAHQTLLALGYLHHKNVVHRDIAPDNLMLTVSDDGHPAVKLIDLGVAKALDRTVELTSTGMFLGKVRYCSPEQLGGLAAGEKLDGRSDLYSLGVVLYRVLTRELPFTGSSTRELYGEHLFKPPRPFSETDPDGRVPEPVRSAVLKALEKRREDRFGTAEEFDVEIVRLQELFGRPETRKTALLVKGARETLDNEVTVATPTASAQDRLDRQFEAAPTPPPTLSTEAMTVTAPTSDVTAREKTLPPTVPLPIPPPSSSGSRFSLLPWAAGTAAVAVLALVFGLPLLRERAIPPPASPAVVPTAAPPAQQSPQITTASTAAGPAPENAVSPRPSDSAGTAPSGQAPATEGAAAEAAETAKTRAASERARLSAASARTAAEKVEAPALAWDTYSKAIHKEVEGRERSGKQDYTEAKTAFSAAADLFREAEKAAHKEAGKRLAEHKSNVDRLNASVGDTLQKVTSEYDTEESKALVGGKQEKVLAANRVGLQFFFGGGDRVAMVRIDPPFRGAIEGIRLGDSLDLLTSKKGKPTRRRFKVAAADGYLYDSAEEGKAVRYDVDPSTKKVVRIFIGLRKFPALEAS